MSEEKKAALKQHLNQARQRLLEIVGSMSGDDWNIKVQSDGDQWTALQMIRHLQDAHRGLTGQVKRVLAGGESVPRDFDVNRWNARAQTKAAEVAMTPEQALEALKQSHEDLLGIVDGLTDADLDRRAWQAFLQKEITLEEFIRVIGTHEAGHAEEIAAAVKK